MKKLVIMPGGFHPWHAGHTALYQAARTAFPSADVFVAATADTTTRPFPFKIKKMLAQAAGVPANRFIQVKSPFSAQEITQMYDPAETQLIFVRSEKDQNQNPQAGGIKKNGQPSYLQPYRRMGLQPMANHAYMHYLPVAQFGPGMTSATEIRSKWPEMTDQQKSELVSTIYPAAGKNPAAINKLIEILDSVLILSEVEVVETVDTDDQSIPSASAADSNSVSALIQQLSMAVAYIKQQDFEAVRDLVTDPSLIMLLDHLIDGNINEPVIDTELSFGSDNLDYAEEK